MTWLSFFSNPITFAAVTVVAIGIIVYEIVNRNEERVPAQGCRYGNPVPDSSSITAYRNSDSNIRHRKFEDSETKSFTKNKVTKHGVDNKSSDGLKDAAWNSQFDVKNYSKDVFDKIESDVRNINQRDERMKTFSKNIAENDSDSSDSSENNNSTDSNERKLVNMSYSETNVKDTLQNFSGASSSRSVKVKQENIAGSQDTKQTNFDYRNAIASTSANDQQNSMKLCMACDEAFANAVAYPCKHCYLCIDCAHMIHRIYDKCICNSVVEEFKTLRR